MENRRIQEINSLSADWYSECICEGSKQNGQEMESNEHGEAHNKIE